MIVIRNPETKTYEFSPRPRSQLVQRVEPDYLPMHCTERGCTRPIHNWDSWKCAVHDRGNGHG
jgi:hypothetical protein